MFMQYTTPPKWHSPASIHGSRQRQQCEVSFLGQRNAVGFTAGPTLRTSLPSWIRLLILRHQMRDLGWLFNQQENLWQYCRVLSHNTPALYKHLPIGPDSTCAWMYLIQCCFINTIRAGFPCAGPESAILPEDDSVALAFAPNTGSADDGGHDSISEMI